VRRGEATGLYNLSRNVGSSIGISIVSYLLIRNSQINHEMIASHVTAVNRGFADLAIRDAWSPWTASGRAALDQVIEHQASIISYMDDFKLLMILSIAVTPLVFLLRRASNADAPTPAEVME
jgi:DHA2 family multidrug resistance protein